MKLDERKQLLTELVTLEIAHRRRRGEAVNLDNYEAVLPEMSTLTPEERAELADSVERSPGDGSVPEPTQIGAIGSSRRCPKGARLARIGRCTRVCRPRS